MTVSAPSSSADAALAREIVSGLIDACRDGEYVFNFVGRSVTDPKLRAELVQYGVQRQEFIAELHQAIRSIGDDAGDRGPASRGDDRRWKILTRAAVGGDRSTMLDECDRHELAALAAYRDALHAALPYAIASVIYSQFTAITRVQCRLQFLADAARGNSPIDNRDV
jgi:uncharacterized protein (TIGR02284 family)